MDEPEQEVFADRQLSREQLKRLSERMHDVAERVYWLFFHAGMGAEVHAFIEFCGLLNKYVEICRRCADAGIDFTQFNTHTGQAMPVLGHDMRYFGEKLQCIIGPIIDGNQDARAALKRELFGEEEPQTKEQKRALARKLGFSESCIESTLGYVGDD